jgi:putative FmdB family regulatory protein
MPTYGYRCTVCSHEFERVQKITDPRLTECEECNGPVKKIIYPVGIAFKGEGFYINDSKKEAPSKSKPVETKAETESKPAEVKTESGATETKTETKTETAAPAAKPETKPAA